MMSAALNIHHKAVLARTGGTYMQAQLLWARQEDNMTSLALISLAFAFARLIKTSSTILVT